MSTRIRAGWGLGIGLVLATLVAPGRAQNFTMTDRAEDTSVSRQKRRTRSEVKASSRTFVRYNSVGGNQARSFFQEGWFYEEHVSLQESGRNARGNEFQFNVDLRVTNEDRVDPDSFLVQNFSYREWNERFMLEVGDIFHEFNHLTLNRNLKGVAYTSFASPSRGPWTYTMLAGVDKSRWRDLFVDTPRESLTRWAFGMRAKRDFRGGLDSFAFNFVSSKDSRTSAPQNPGLIAGESTVVSFDGKKTLNDDWKAFGTLAFSKSQANIALNTKERWASAVHLDVQYAPKDGKVFGRTRFQSTDPEFLSLEGSPVPDFEKFDTQWRYQASDQVEIVAKWETFENNLDGQLGFTTETEVPSLSATYRSRTSPLRLDLRWEDRDIQASNNSQSQEIEDWSLRVEHRFGTIRGVLDYNSREDANLLTAATIESDQYTLTVDTRKRYASGVQFMPAIVYQYREQDNLVNQSVDDEITTLNLRLGWILRRNRSLQFAYRVSEREDGLNASDSETDGFEVNYAMPVGRNRDDQLTFRYLHNDNQFQVAGNDFDETMTQFSYTHRF